MKSFNQFLQEAYLSEEESRQGSLFTRSGKPQNFRNPKKVPFTATDPTPIPASKRLSAVSSPTTTTQSPGQLEIPEPKTTRVSGSQFRNAGEARQGLLFTRSGTPQKFKKGTPFVATEPVSPVKRLPSTSPESPKPSPGQQEIRQLSNPPTTRALPPGKPGGELAKTINAIPDSMARGAYDAARSRKPSSGRLSKVISPSIEKPSSPGKLPVQSTSRLNRSLSTMKSEWQKGLPKPGIAGKALGAAGAAYDVGSEYMSQKARGRSTPAAAAMGVTKAAGGAAAGAAGAQAGAALGAGIGAAFGGVGAAPGAAIGGLVGGIGGYMGGSELAGRASETIAGATGKEKAAMAKANRQRQAGTAIRGIGGQTTFSQRKPGGPAFMSTGVGKQRKTVQLPQTGVVHRKNGKDEKGYLAFKDGQAVYKAGPKPETLAKTSSNWAERFGRSVLPGAYIQHDIQKARQDLKKARLSDTARLKKLGVKYGPGR